VAHEGSCAASEAITVTEAERESIFSTVRECVLAALPSAIAIYVSGSIARGDEFPGSDVDVAVLLPHGESVGDSLALMAAIATRVKRDVDVVDLRAAGDVLRGEVLRDGRTVFAADENAVLDWEATAMTRYQRHREELRELHADFARTGVGYRE
jgi:predicted nucleotidyltransferase